MSYPIWTYLGGLICGFGMGLTIGSLTQKWLTFKVTELNKLKRRRTRP